MATGSQSGWHREGGRRHEGEERREQMMDGVGQRRMDSVGQRSFGEKKRGKFLPTKCQELLPSGHISLLTFSQLLGTRADTGEISPKVWRESTQQNKCGWKGKAECVLGGDIGPGNCGRL